MRLPRVFIGSSTEALDIAYAVQQNLDDDAECTVWKQGIFDLSQSNLQALVAAAETADFAVFVFAPDDVVTLRDSARRAVRDNVLFEFGLFAGRLGVGRTFFVLPRTGDLHLPTDLLGVSGETYNDRRDDHNLQAALGPACSAIRKRLRASPREAAPAPSLPLGLAKSIRAGSSFQSFEIQRPGGNINPVSRLWADAVRANTLSAAVDLTESFLRVRFTNHEKSYPGNVTIRPQGEEALAPSAERPVLTFEARVPAGEGDGLLDEVAVAVRLINGWDQHWEHGDNPNEYLQLRVSGEAWQRYAVELSSRRWFLFRGDGHVHGGPVQADFKVLCGVVLELGSHNVPGRPGPGSGVIDIRRIRLEEEA